ncbi:hypothetical protein J22TS3_07880 [Paenibacillus sp. J22TS3]|nr:hypothetical protein [Paenibacillus sp. J22TS3]GIP20513.1 hypothetical protein J22TS3_07880 [Paenibacillus sp. J22TS3]
MSDYPKQIKDDEQSKSTSSTNRVDYPRQTHQEEYSSDISSGTTSRAKDKQDTTPRSKGTFAELYNTPGPTSDYPRRAHREEYGADIAPGTTYIPASRTNGKRDTTSRSQGTSAQADNTAGRTAGYIGVALGIASMFIWSIILGPIAAILGFYAYSQGRRTAGAWAAGLGIIATLSYFVLIPFTR